MSSLLVDERFGISPEYYIAPQPKLLMRIPDQVLQCVVFLCLDRGNEAPKYGGTAFLVGVPASHPRLAGMLHTYLVTAAHCADQLVGLKYFIRANTKDRKSRLFNGDGVRWYRHPVQPLAVDVAVTPWVIPSDCEYRLIETPEFGTPEVLSQNGIGIGDEVFITGLFNRAHGVSRNMPIIRTGSVAMIPEDPVLGEMEAYLIEARSIGGISGSPVFVRQTFSYSAARNGAPVTAFAGGKFFFFGLMHGHWDIKSEDMNDYAFPSGKGVNLGIAIVVPAFKILETLNSEELLQMRKRTEETAVKEKQDKEGSATRDSALGAEASSEFTREDFEAALRKVSRKIKPGDS